jgi:hypothetical protein
MTMGASTPPSLLLAWTSTAALPSAVTSLQDGLSYDRHKSCLKMSVFQRLRSVPLADVLHRGFLYSLVGISGWGIYMMGAVHMDTLRRGRGASPTYWFTDCYPQQLAFAEVRAVRSWPHFRAWRFEDFELTL